MLIIQVNRNVVGGTNTIRLARIFFLSSLLLSSSHGVYNQKINRLVFLGASLSV